MITQQMEIGFEQQPKLAPARRLRHRSRAPFWFSRMRQVVGQALDWTPKPPARPQQIYLTLAKSR